MVARAAAAEEKAARLERELQEALGASHRPDATEPSKAVMFWGPVFQLADGVCTLERSCRVVWASTSLGDVELLPWSDSPPDELYLLPRMGISGDWLWEIDGALR